MNFTFMTDEKYKFVNEFLIYAKTQNKLSLRNSVKIDLCNVWEIMHFEFLMDIKAQLDGVKEEYQKRQILKNPSMGMEQCRNRLCS